MNRELRDDELNGLLGAASRPAPAGTQGVFNDVWARVSAEMDDPDSGGDPTGVTGIDQARIRVLFNVDEGATRPP